MKKFIENVKHFLKNALLPISIVFGAMVLSAFVVDRTGMESMAAKIVGIFWLLVLLAGILLFSGVGNPIKQWFLRLVGLKKKNDENISNKKG